MKVAIIGASGHVGTALLRALGDEPQVDDIVGIARRLPDVTRDPYRAARWERIDIAVPTADAAGEERAVARLAEALVGVDVVVHLAWLIQPNRNRELLRRTNVDGTRRVVAAMERAGVGRLVCASSVGAYSGVRDDDRRDESWPTQGIRSSHYSADKADQERVLDDAEARGLSVARVRPALVFDGYAGAQITRLFVGALVPPRLLRPGTLPILPLPAGLRMQVVHGDDLADAYRRIVVGGADGAFNIATEPVLDAEAIAAIVDHGRHVPVPPAALRPLLHAAWRLHAVAADPGWLDMAMRVPVMDTARARDELGWAPSHGAAETLREVLRAIADGTGTASAPMRPRRRWPHDQLPPGDVPAGRSDAPTTAADGHRVPVGIDRELLGLYLSDHLTGATAGVARIRRMATAVADTELSPDLGRIAGEIAAERTFLRELISGLELRRRPYRQAVAWLAERAGRLKTNGRVTGSPMTPVLELELMRSAVIGKLGGWETLAALAPDLGLPVETFRDLADRARAQAATFEELHARVLPDAFRRDDR
ncbi:NAD-dependent epimerase/dehydratase family protein [Microbacterium sediminis]|uniref:Epimerase n=1 Tax=Microbacterium sediminis TaxID=904291 RepID=A0A1B9NGS3_9MICO|nr:NAD-dependent epimerase/dehydratase family protein [Microbacterium sediminis]OCG75792.1 epimerase [Microbacterium sediminis]